MLIVKSTFFPVILALDQRHQNSERRKVEIGIRNSISQKIHLRKNAKGVFVTKTSMSMQYIYFLLRSGSERIIIEWAL